MERPSEQGAPGSAQPLSGRKLYSPGALAGYTALVCLPVGYILYGLNLKARGYRRLGLSWVYFGAACLAFIYLMPPRFAPVSSIVFGSGVFGAIALFQLESGPYALATSKGATRARWWPPALIILAAALLLFVIAWLRQAVA